MSTEAAKQKAFGRGMRRLESRRKADAPPDACPMCHEPHHTDLVPALVPPSKDGRFSPMVDPIVKDALWHVTIDAYRALETSHNAAAALELLPAISDALGWLMGACEERGRRFGWAEGVERFFDAIVKAQGYGTYEIEIGPTGRSARRAQA